MRKLQTIMILVLLAVLIGFPAIIFGYYNFTLAENRTDDNEASAYYETSAKFLFWKPEILELAGLREHKSPSRAIKLLTTAKRRNSLSFAGRIALGDAYFSNGQIDKAIDEWENLLLDDKDNQVAISRLVHIFHSRQQFSREEQFLARWLVIDENNLEANEHMGMYLASLASVKAATYLEVAAAISAKEKSKLEGLIQALNIPEDDISYKLVKSGQALANLGEWNLAERAFVYSTEVNSRYALAWAWLGLARQRNNSPGALESLQHALEMEEKSAAINGMLGTYWQLSGRQAEAQSYFLKATSLEPENPAWWLALAQTTSKSNLPSALNAYVQAVNRAPRDANVWSALARFCLENNAYIDEYGLKAALRAFALDSNNPDAMDLLGRLQMVVGQTQASEIMILKAINSGTNSSSLPAYHFHLGLLYLQTSKMTQAEFEFNKTVELDANGSSGVQARKLIERYFP